MTPPDIVNDAQRLAALASYDILDTPPEPGFDEVVHIARVLCDAPVALVSLVGQDRQWFKARDGFAPSETDLASSVCAHALLEPDLLVIGDLAADPRTLANPLVTGEPRIRFYAGAPLRTPAGEVLGSLCVIDVAPRPAGLSPKQASALRNLAAQVMAQLELRRALADRDALLRQRAQAVARREDLLKLGDDLREAETEKEMIRIASRLVGRALDASRAGFGHLDARTEHIDIVQDWTREGIASIAGRHRFEDYGDLLPDILRGDPLVIHDVRADPRTAADPEPMLALQIGSLVNVPVRDRGRTVAMLIAQDDRPRAWSAEELVFLRNVADRLEVGVGRLRAEADQRILNHELSHRMKNMMAMVQAIATQTLKGVPDRAPVDALLKRLLALASAHDALLTADWTSAPIGATVASVIARFGLDDGRFAMGGPEVQLGPRATLSLAMLAHELATNAVKHGALSVEAGKASAFWRVEQDGGEPELVLEWRETGGPPAREPAARGFGSRLINMGLVGSGGVDLRFLPSGLEGDFRAPLHQVRQS
ncbi:sensor histidine kinase [Chenggangzhangella methanolivorans]|uniref:sensor histidine kinase n=1 Tax=Chenggangzhangella methanolivorans TaxID=1437009 RepID=UPI0021BDADC8|nr:GAF domain-containing protein [Chenggangzhangella methanolivorans]